MSNADAERVAAGYDAVYSAIPRSPTFARLWRTHALGPDYPEGFEHISFLTLAEMRAMVDELRLAPGSTLVDLACGMGGPGLWIARETGAHLMGVDVSGVAVANAEARAATLGLAAIAQFRQGTFAATGLEAASLDAAMSVDALQYAPDKAAALREAARILRPGGRLAFTVFELLPERVAALPVLGTDPVAEYAPLLESAGFYVTLCIETAGWRERMTATYRAVIDARSLLTSEMGEAACNALLGEMVLTLERQPYRRRVFISAARRPDA